MDIHLSKEKEETTDYDQDLPPQEPHYAMKKFERRIEDFTCENCNTFVQGDGYTDHCPECLYSKHVDINPGDRNCDCHGLMKPIAAEVKGDSYKIHYECNDCGYKHKVRSSPNDNFDVILKLIGEPINN